MKWNEFHQAIFSTTVEVRTIECISDSSWLTREKKQTLSAMTMQKVETMTMQKIMQQIMQKMETMTMQKRGQVVFNWRAQFSHRSGASTISEGGDNDNAKSGCFEQESSLLTSVTCWDKFCDAFVQGCTSCGCRAARKWRENKKTKRKWREYEEMEGE